MAHPTLQPVLKGRDVNHIVTKLNHAADNAKDREARKAYRNAATLVSMQFMLKEAEAAMATAVLDDTDAATD